MPKALRFEVFVARTDQFKEQSLGATPSLFQGSPAVLDFAFFDEDGALIDLSAYTDITLEVWQDQEDGPRLLSKTIEAADFDLTADAESWKAKTKQPVRFALTGSELNFEIAAGKTSQTFFMVVGGTPVDGEPETLGYATLKLIKDRFGEGGETVEADPASYLSAAQSDARYAQRGPVNGAYRIKTDETGSYLQVKNATTGGWHTIFAAGAEGAEILTIGPGEDVPETP